MSTDNRINSDAIINIVNELVKECKNEGMSTDNRIDNDILVDTVKDIVDELLKEGK